MRTAPELNIASVSVEIECWDCRGYEKLVLSIHEKQGQRKGCTSPGAKSAEYEGACVLRD
jgi:hypothetical protein